MINLFIVNPYVKADKFTVSKVGHFIANRNGPNNNSFLLPLIQEGQLSVSGKSMYWLTALEVLACPGKADRPDMTINVYRGRKTTTQQQPFVNMARIFNCAKLVSHRFTVTKPKRSKQRVQIRSGCSLSSSLIKPSIFVATV